MFNFVPYLTVVLIDSPKDPDATIGISEILGGRQNNIIFINSFISMQNTGTNQFYTSFYENEPTVVQLDVSFFQNTVTWSALSYFKYSLSNEIWRTSTPSVFGDYIQYNSSEEKYLWVSIG